MKQLFFLLLLFFSFQFLFCNPTKWYDDPDLMSDRVAKVPQIDENSDMVIPLLSEKEEDKAPVQKLFSGQHVKIDYLTLRPGSTIQGVSEKNTTTIFIIKTGSLTYSDSKGKFGSYTLNEKDMVRIWPKWSYTLQNSEKSTAIFYKVSFISDTHHYEYTQNRSAVKGSIAVFKDQITVREKGIMNHLPNYIRNIVHSFQDMLSPRDLYLMIGRSNWPPGTNYAVKSPSKFLITLAGTEEGNGPALHIHRYTDEIFIALEGSYEISWGDQGENRIVLEEGDMVAVPKLVNRTFKCLSKSGGMMMPIVLGTDKELDDIIFLPQERTKLIKQHHISPNERLSSFYTWVAKRFIGLKFLSRDYL